MDAPIAIGVWVTTGMAVAYVFGGVLVAAIGRRFGSRAAMYCIAAVSIVVFGVFIVLAMPIEQAAVVSAIQSALIHALPFVFGWIVVGVLVHSRVFRRTPSHKQQR
jgi:hypothetical protein